MKQIRFRYLYGARLMYNQQIYTGAYDRTSDELTHLIHSSDRVSL